MKENKTEKFINSMELKIQVIKLEIEALDRSKELAARGSTNTVPEKDYVRTNSGSIDADASGLTTLNYGEKAPVGGEMSSRRGVLPRVG